MPGTAPEGSQEASGAPAPALGVACPVPPVHTACLTASPAWGSCQHRRLYRTAGCLLSVQAEPQRLPRCWNFKRKSELALECAPQPTGVWADAPPTGGPTVFLAGLQVSAWPLGTAGDRDRGPHRSPLLSSARKMLRAEHNKLGHVPAYNLFLPKTNPARASYAHSSQGTSGHLTRPSAGASPPSWHFPWGPTCCMLSSGDSSRPPKWRSRCPARTDPQDSSGAQRA